MAQLKGDVMSNRRWGLRLLLPVYLCLALLLGGCVRYDVGINFQSPTYGEMIQHIQLGDRLTSFSRATAQDWLQSIRGRANKLGGKTKRISDDEVIVTIPFNNGKDLQQKFNQFFNPVESQSAANSLDSTLPDLSSRLDVKQSNLIFFVRNRLVFDLDLRSLGVISSEGSVLISPGTLLDLQFSLHTPWGLKTIVTEDETVVTPVSVQADNQTTWTLQPGQINHIEVIFWLPSQIGIGGLLIILLVVAGSYLKGKQQPATVNP